MRHRYKYDARFRRLSGWQRRSASRNHGHVFQRYRCNVLRTELRWKRARCLHIRFFLPRLDRKRSLVRANQSLTNDRYSLVTSRKASSIFVTSLIYTVHQDSSLPNIIQDRQNNQRQILLLRKCISAFFSAQCDINLHNIIKNCGFCTQPDKFAFHSRLLRDFRFII